MKRDLRKELTRIKNDIYNEAGIFKIQDREAGNVIDADLTKEQAEELLRQYEEADKKDGIYTPNFYEIVESEV